MFLLRNVKSPSLVDIGSIPFQRANPKTSIYKTKNTEKFLIKFEQLLSSFLYFTYLCENDLYN